MVEQKFIKYSKAGGFKKLLEMIDNNNSIIKVKHSPQLLPTATPNNCYINVENIVNIQGGELKYGWMLVQSISFLVEAIAHAIWKSPSGELFCITPQQYNLPDEIDFIEDRQNILDGTFRDNKRFILHHEQTECMKNIVRLQELNYLFKKLYLTIIKDITGSERTAIKLNDKQKSVTYKENGKIKKLPKDIYELIIKSNELQDHVFEFIEYPPDNFEEIINDYELKLAKCKKIMN